MFGFGRKKTIETMLAELASAGIALRPGVKPDALLAQFSRDDIERKGYEMLLAVMGDDQMDLKTFEELPPLTDDVWHFDAEAIEDHGSYKRIVTNCARLTGGDLAFDRVDDYLDVDGKVAWVELTTAAGKERIDFKIDNDWVDPKVFDLLDAKLVQSGSKRRFQAHGLGQDCLIICKPPEEIRQINQLTSLRFGKLNI